MPRPAHDDRRPAPAYVRLRGLPPRSVAHVKWWTGLVREVKSLARSAAMPPGGARSALRHARAGFLPSHTRLYDLEGPHGDAYLSDHQRELTWVIDWPAAGLLDDKLAFFFMLRGLGVPTPEVSGVVTRGRLHELGAAPSPGDSSWLRRRLEQRGRVIIRPTRSGGGQGLWVVEHLDDGCRLNGLATDWAEFERRLERLDDHLVTDFAEQAAYARTIFPGATNTVRVLTMHDAEGRAFIAGAVHRFGSNRSAPADNWLQGGLSVDIDPETGTLGRGASRPAGGGLGWHDAHPDTGAALRGVVVPNWAAVRDGIVTAAAKMPFLPYVGWDVIVTEDGFSVVEGNKFSGVVALQVHRPLLSDPRARAFYAEHGIA